MIDLKYNPQNIKKRAGAGMQIWKTAGKPISRENRNRVGREEKRRGSS